MGRVALTALLVQSALVQAITFLLRPASTYQAISLDVPPAALGAIGATFAIVPLALAVPVGGLVDRVGEKRVTLAGTVLLVGSSATFLWGSDSVAGLVIANALLGAGHLGCVIGQQALVANIAGPGRDDPAGAGRLDAWFGYYTFVASAGQAVGPSLLGLVGGTSVQPDTRAIFTVALGMCAAQLALSFLLPRHTAASGADGRQPGGFVTLLRTSGLARALTTSAIILAAVDLTLVYLPALGADRDLGAGVVGALLTVRAVFSMASRLTLGWMARRLGRTRLMALSIIISGLSLGACALPVPVWALLVAVAAMGLGLGVGQPLTMSWLTEQAPPGRRGQALSLRLAGNRLGQVLVPAGIGLVAGGSGAAVVLAATGAVVGSSLLLLRGFSLDE